MRTLVLVIGAGAAVGGGVAWWRRHPRLGAAWVNRVVDPWLVRQGVTDRTRGEIGLLEHVGRRSGIVRLTPVHPVPTADGFRIIVPLGMESHWARNVLAAKTCRIEVQGVVHELREPALLAPPAVDGVPRLAGLLMDWLGFRYLVLRRVAQAPGSLGRAVAPVGAARTPAETPDGLGMEPVAPAMA